MGSMTTTAVSIPRFPLDGIRRHKLLTKADARTLTPRLSSDGQGDDAIVRIKFFHGSHTWFVTEGWQEEDGSWTFFGSVDVNGQRELGEFTLNELATTRGRFGLPIERDCWFTPCRLGDAR